MKTLQEQIDELIDANEYTIEELVKADALAEYRGEVIAELRAQLASRPLQYILGVGRAALALYKVARETR